MISLATILYVMEYQALLGPSQRLQRSLRAQKVHESISLAHFADGSHESFDKSSKILPMLNETGGLVVFLHIAKTGGTTIREDFRDESNFPNVKVKRVYGEEQIKLIKSKIDWHLSSENDSKSILLLEVHGGHGQPMTVFDLHDYIQSWRQQAAAQNRGVFVFTILREPVAFYVSYFTYFTNTNCQYIWCDRPLMESTEENLLQSAISNHQCQYLTRKWDRKDNRKHPVTVSECKAAYSLLRSDADWVGTTETMQETTLPLLSYIMTGETKTGQSLATHNQQNGLSLNAHSLSDKARTELQYKSTLDRYLYESAQADYRLGIFHNFNEVRSA